MLVAVFDTNVLVSALYNPEGVPGRLVAEWGGGAFELVVSEQLLAELERVLQSLRYTGDKESAATLTRMLRVAARLVEDPAEVQRVVGDPADDYLVALARAAEAHVIVTGDRHLLELIDLRPQPVTPRQFAVLLERHGF